MKIPIIIPSYQRSHIIISKTLNLLERLCYSQKDIFVVVEDNEDVYNEYYDVISSMYPRVNVLVGDNSNGQASQINFIKTEILMDKQLALIMDDDIDEILVAKDKKTLLPITPEQFEVFLCIAPNLMREFNIGLCGVNSTGNPFYMGDKVRLCKSNICGGFQLFFNEPDLILKSNQGNDSYTSCWYLDKFKDNLKFDFITIKTKLFTAGGFYEIRQDKERTNKEYKSVALEYPQYLDYYEWKEGEPTGIDSKGNIVKIPKSRQKNLTLELRWKKLPSITIRNKEDVFPFL
tara:strand:- start:105 stop:974 length:870 start_codon:yes stop_codon:yes gene_type:complete